MEPFEKALLDAVTDEFSHVPPEDALDFAPISLKKVRKTSTLRRCLLAAAVCILLVTGVLAAYTIQYRIGQVDIETDVTKIFSFVSEIDDDGNNYHSITFTEDFSNPDAPDKIETFYLPETENMTIPYSNGWYISSTGNGTYHPFTSPYLDDQNDRQIDYEKILAEPTSVEYEYALDDFAGSRIYFSQYPAKDATDGTAFMNFSYGRDAGITTYTETIEIDEYSLFAFNLDMTALDLGNGETGNVSRNWFWTNGDYVFVLTGSLSVEEMTEIFRSVRPVSTSYPYIISRDSYTDYTIKENFDLIDSTAE